MTNYDRWLHLTEALESPQDFIDMAWYFAVSTAIERRVWLSDFSQPVLIAQYIMLVGPPGIGKGTAMRAAFRLLGRFSAKNLDGTDRHCKDEPRELEPRFFSMPDTITFEELVHSIADHIVPFMQPDGNIYTHSSCYFGLEELSSIMRKNKTDDVCRFLQNMYDGVPYRYSTRKSGKARIKNGCLNFIAGTQVDFIRRIEKDGQLGEGLISRFLMVYAETKRHVLFNYPPLSDTQKAAQDHLQRWLYGLGNLFGPLQYASKEDEEFLQQWWESEDKYLERFLDSKLANYFDRRKVHVMKLAAAIHFGESTELVIQRSAFEKAIDIIRRFESGTIRVAQKAGRNQAYPIQERLVSFIRMRPRSHAEVCRFLQSDMDLTEIMNTIQLLKEANRIKLNGESTWTIVKEILNSEEESP